MTTAVARPFRFGVVAVTPRPSMADWVGAARRFESLGYATIHFTDHFDRSPVAPLPMLAALATATESITLGTLVLDNDFRHPAVLAKELATLDLIAPGRIEPGLGAGWMHADYEVSGIAFDPPRVRIDRMEEALLVLDGVLRGGPATVAGAHYQVHSLLSTPPPTTLPRPRLLVGGGGQRVLRIAGRHADIVSVNWQNAAGRVVDEAVRSGGSTPTQHKIDAIRAGAGDRFGDIELHLLAYVAAITDDPRGSAASFVAQRDLGLGIDEVLGAPHCLVGSVDDVVERVVALREQFGIGLVGDAAAGADAPVLVDLDACDRRFVHVFLSSSLRPTGSAIRRRPAGRPR
ncbi:MAG: TIGR03621 family F420-dependent LLM class oxidoreductase [Actinobacteria bacterium]|nr:TIGR03621 family F420-dependent LLM class oxidoreductase [Actinomycetota bacterium]